MNNTDKYKYIYIYISFCYKVLYFRKSSVIPASKNSWCIAPSLPRSDFIFAIFPAYYTMNYDTCRSIDFQKKPYIYRPSVINCSTIFDATTPDSFACIYIYIYIFTPFREWKGSSPSPLPRVINVVIVFTRNRIRKIFTKDNFEFSIRSYHLHLHLCKQF